MPRKLVERYDCSRCNRVWYEDYVEGAEPPPVGSLEAKFGRGGDVKVVKFTELCQSCMDAIEGYLRSITKEKDPEAKKKPDASSDEA